MLAASINVCVITGSSLLAVLKIEERKEEELGLFIVNVGLMNNLIAGSFG